MSGDESQFSVSECPQPSCVYTNGGLANYEAAAYEAYSNIVNNLPSSTTSSAVDTESRLELLTETLCKVNKFVNKVFAKISTSKCAYPCVESAAEAISQASCSLWQALTVAFSSSSLVAGDSEDSLNRHVNILVCSYEMVVKTILTTVLCPKVKCHPVLVKRVKIPKYKCKKNKEWVVKGRRCDDNDDDYDDPDEEDGEEDMSDPEIEEDD